MENRNKSTRRIKAVVAVMSLLIVVCLGLVIYGMAREALHLFAD
jgi:hypothetical protein